MLLRTVARFAPLAPLALLACGGTRSPAQTAAQAGPRFAVCFVDRVEAIASCKTEAVVTEADIETAVASGNTVIIDLNRDSASRFDTLIKANTGRRMMVLVNGKLQGAPVANGTIDARHFEITVANAAEAKPLSVALSPAARNAP